ncbi:MAG: DegQ family serine endoprotease [Candidatus Tectomicrobia bacterium]|uniref:Probable periplasmic serine endoprotease DegP-like n=1 Tax=Tectimicrobiota bacterium TaxID=2528274 RepID=A0A932GRI7_UNCTE|nr:DegQ family serine endoprotease [Candidatus Tectomicrobia bacterium]
MAKKQFGMKSVILVALGFLILGLLISSQSNLTTRLRAEKLWTEGSSLVPVRNPGDPLPSFSELVKKLKPSVVNISTAKLVKGRPRTPRTPRPQDPFGRQNPFHDFFERFFGDNPPREFRQRSLGSGFIINQEGYVVTNNHVIEDTDEIQVKLANEKEYEAEVVGRDSKTDLALIRIKGKGPFPVAALGDSDNLDVGEWVLAIGNPFGFEHSVTAGIVSAKGRVIGAGPYDNYIQTDASINPGNSGGPLFNIRGEVVGINTAIISTGQGIGFAMPVNMVKDLLPQLRESGKVKRGWLGVSIQSVNEELASSFGMGAPRGALVTSVMEGEPADKAGVKRGDIIVRFNGKEVKDVRELQRVVAGTPIGSTVDLAVFRDGKEVRLTVRLTEMTDEKLASSPTPQKSREEFGMVLEDITPALAQDLGLGEARGVVVSEVQEGSAASRAGIQEGDVIQEVNREKVSNLKEYKARLEKAKGKDSLVFYVKRKDRGLFLVVKRTG